MAEPEVQPGRRQPAPEPLRLVQVFINTRDIEAGTDEIDSPGRLGAWLRAEGLGDGEPTPEDLERFRAAREALRALVLANNGEPQDRAAIATLNREAGRARLVVRFSEDGTPQLAPGGRGVDAALATILAAVERAGVEGTWDRLKACRNHTCGWAFYDRSRNRSGTWCTMAVCGNVMKARAYRRRRASEGA